jgi:serine phosphatase RsbU (regulator of sigma subunit)
MTERLGSRSLSAKLGYLMTLVISFTVIALTVQSAGRFSSYIIQNIEESSTSLAERTAREVSYIIENWLSQMAVTVSRLPAQSSPQTSADTGLTAALRADRDLLAANLYVVTNGQAKLLRYAQQPAKDATAHLNAAAKLQAIKVAMDTLAKEAAGNSKIFTDDRVIRNITPEAKSPTILMALKLSIPGNDSTFAMIAVVADMTRIQLSLPQSRNTSGFIIDGKGFFFASTDEDKIAAKKTARNNDLVKKALELRAPSGFLANYSSGSNREQIGSYAQLPGSLPFFVIVERDRAAAFQAVSKLYMSSALWGLLLILLAAMASYLTAGTITKNLKNLVSATKRIAGGDFAVRLQPNTNDEVAILSHSVNHMAGKIQFLMSAEVEKARFVKELETAQMVQSTFFPKKEISKNFLSVTGSYQPATECGGDLWGHFSVSEDIELVFIADAMGHGAPAALVTAIAFAVCKSVETILNEDSAIDTSPSRLLKRLNKIILDAVDGKISMTFFVAVIDFKTGKMTYSNAGHNFPFVLATSKDDPRLGASAKRSTNQDSLFPITLTLQGNPLGVEADSEFKEKTLKIAAGDKIILFTDGLIENTRNGSEPLGRKSLIDLASKAGAISADALKELLKSEGAARYGFENLADDVTIVVAEISSHWKVQEKSITGADAPVAAAPSLPILNLDYSVAGITVPPPPPELKPIPVPVVESIVIEKEAVLDLAPPSDLPNFPLSTGPEERIQAEVPVSAAFDLGSDATPESDLKLETSPQVKPVRSTG